MTTSAEVIMHLRRLGTATDEATPTRIAPTRRAAEPRWGVRMGELFDLAKAHAGMDLTEVDKLFDEPAYEPRLTAVAVLDIKARRARSDEERRVLCDL